MMSQNPPQENTNSKLQDLRSQLEVERLKAELLEQQLINKRKLQELEKLDEDIQRKRAQNDV
jgi:hypothetical protein